MLSRDEFPDFVPGTRDLPLSAKRMNPLMRLARALLSLKVVRGQTDGFFLSDENAILQLKESTGGGTTTTTITGSSIAYYKIVSVQPDYLVCHTWNALDSAEGTAEVYVAKPWVLWETRAVMTDEDGTWGMTVPAGQTGNNRARVKTLGSTTETQKVSPRWCVGEVIQAYQTTGTGIILNVNGSAVIVTLQMINDGRAWARI